MLSVPTFITRAAHSQTSVTATANSRYAHVPAAAAAVVCKIYKAQPQRKQSAMKSECDFCWSKVKSVNPGLHGNDLRASVSC